MYTVPSSSNGDVCAGVFLDGLIIFTPPGPMTSPIAATGIFTEIMRGAKLISSGASIALIAPRMCRLSLTCLGQCASEHGCGDTVELGVQLDSGHELGGTLPP